MKKIQHLYYSRLCSVPYLQNIIYFFEFIIIKLNITSWLIASNFDEKNRNTLFSMLDTVDTTLYIRSSRFGYSLKKFKFCTLVCDFSNSNASGSEILNNCMWSFVLSSSISMNTAKLFKNFINKNQQIYTKIIIPYREEMTVHCDFVIKTLRQLSKIDTVSVQCIAYKYPITPFSLLKKNVDFEKSLKSMSDVKLFRPLALMPYYTHMPWKLRQLNEFIIDLSIRFFLYRLKPDVVWSFDPDDASLAEFAATRLKCATIYDCVDYFSSMNHEINNQIYLNQIRLIKSVRYFFVNSQTLHKLHEKIRNDAEVVVQGFDAEGFKPTKLFSSKMNQKQLRIGFAGIINYRFDFKLLFKLIERNPTWTFCFTDAYQKNPTEAPEKSVKKKVDQLKKYANVSFAAQTTSKKKIQRFIASFDIAIIPYDITIPLCRYSYPMKLFEYYFMGKPVISTPIEELKRHGDFVTIASSYSEWEAAIKRIVENEWSMSKAKKQRQMALNNSWKIKVEQILNSTINQEIFI